MKQRTILILVLIVVFALGVLYALNREVDRERAKLRESISGRVDVSPDLLARGLADIVKTDRMVLILVDPTTGNPAAMKFDTPFVPPQTFVIGQDDAGSRGQLRGAYYVIGLTDKDGEVFQISPGEVYGRSEKPVQLGSEQFTLTLDQPFRGGLFNGTPPAGLLPAGHPEPGAQPAGEAALSISGTVRAAPKLAGNVAKTDRIVILAFKPDQSQPVAFKILPSAQLPAPFTITVPAGALDKSSPGVLLHVLTDKDNNPFNAAPGEIIGRSKEPVPLGTTGLEFVMDQPYTR